MPIGSVWIERSLFHALFFLREPHYVVQMALYSNLTASTSQLLDCTIGSQIGKHSKSQALCTETHSGIQKFYFHPPWSSSKCKAIV